MRRRCSEKRFRQDLFYRLNVVTLVVPPLRDRMEDMPLLAEHFLERANARNLKKHRLTPAAMERLMGYDFPGNVRELENLVEQAAALAEHEELSASDFPVRVRDTAPSRPAESAGTTRSPTTLAEAVSEAERAAIAAALERYPSELPRVADQLGVSPTTLWRKMKRLGLKTSGEEPIGLPRDTPPH